MKSCPSCGRAYTDDALKFCAKDGATLLVGSHATAEPATLALAAPRCADESSTRLLQTAEASSSTRSPDAAPRAARTNELRPATRRARSLIAALAALSLLVAVAYAIHYFRQPRGGQAIQSIAVLPFTNASGDADTEYLSDGVTETLINNFTRIPAVRVIARSTAFRYKGREVEPRQIGKELDVDAILTGEVLQRGDTLSVQVDLIDARDGRQLWGQRYSLKTSDLLDTQQAIVRDVSARLSWSVSGEQERQVTKRYTENTEAYQLYLKGRYFWNKRTEESYEQAINSFRQAIAIDPNYALAYSGLADSYSFLSGQGIRSPREVFPLAKAAAQKAIELDDTLSEAHTSLAYVLLYYDWDWAGAEKEYRRAIELNPKYPTPHHGYGYLLVSAGRNEEALAEITKAEELDPLSPLIITDHGEFYYFLRQPDQAIEQYRKALDLDPAFTRAHFLLARAYVLKGRCPEGIAEFQKALETSPRSIEMLGALGQGYAACGQRAEVQKVLTELRAREQQQYVSPHLLAAVHAALGERDAAFESLEQAYARRFGPLIYLRVNPIWDNLRDDPRFAVLLQKVGLAQ
jgi:TolB-like protein/Flp pilus assembly protein TadD